MGARAEAIAVVGMAGRFPGARDVAGFWRNLRAGATSFVHLTDNQLRRARVAEERLTDPDYVKVASFLEDCDLFEPALFGITPREAEAMDPQLRVLMEVCHTGLQDAGYDPASYEGRIGVYTGARSNDYLAHNVRADPYFMDIIGEARARIGNQTDFLSTSISFRLGLRGPSLTTVTACSTSLVTVHMACAALLNDECDMALAGGVEIPLPLLRGYQYSDGAGILSPDGVVRPYDGEASGTVFGAGAGVVVLKRLSQALADRDAVHAVVLGSAINNDGASKATYSAPSEAGQAEVLTAALRRADVDPASVGYVEGHGTGTLLGDPVEVAALNRAYGAGRRGTRDCGLGSVKGNVGHLGAAAGICGLIKAVHTVRDGVIPASIGYRTPNPRIGFEAGPFYVVDETVAWPDTGTPRRAGVNSFGVGGTNAHLIVEQPPAAPDRVTRRPYHLLTFSARTATALESMEAELAGRLAEAGDDLADVSYTLTAGRTDHPVRHAVVARDRADAVRRLRGGPAGAEHVLPHGVPPKVAYLLPGQGAQYAGMARGLHEREPVFAKAIDRCADALAHSHGLMLKDILFATEADAAAQARIARTSATQPALFAVEYATACLLRDWGVTPAAMVGHSIGEYVAAALAGVMEVDDALRLVADRGALIESLPTGSMLAVFLSEADLRPLLPPGVDVAAVNAPQVCVVSGPTPAVQDLRRSLSQLDVATTALRTSHAFHSRMMDPVLEEFAERVGRVRLRAPRIPFVSHITGDWITPAQATNPAYWARQVRACVRFSDAAGRLVEDGGYAFVEVGPGHALSNLIGETAKERGVSPVAVPTVGGAQDERDDVHVLLDGIGRLWAHGVPVRWDRYWGDEARGRVHLPVYPYERERFWVEPAESDVGVPKTAATAPVTTADSGLYMPTWTETGPPPALAAEAAVPSGGSTWVVFAQPGEKVAAGLLELAGDAGHDVVVVHPGVEYAEEGDGHVTVRPRESADYARLLTRVRTSGCRRLRLVHAWLVGNRPSRTEQATVRTLLDQGLYSLLAAFQEIARQGSGDPVEVSVVTSGMQDVLGNQDLQPVKAAVRGLVRTASREMGSINVRAVDVGPGEADVLAGYVFREIESEATEQETAYRGRKRWVATYSPVEGPGDVGGGDVPHVLKEEGVYLVTGGLGGLGLELAVQLAEMARARVVLVGRTAELPPRSEWDGLIAGSEDAALVRRLRGLRAVEAAGGRVMVCAGDVVDEARMRAVRARVMRTFGRVTGIFHLAGVPGGGLIEVRDPEAVGRVLAPKIHGTYVLDRVFRPSLLVLYSSIAAVTGDYGQSDYAGANAAMDAYAQAQWNAGRHVVSINWPQWSQTGMAARAGHLLDGYREGAISSAEGARTLRWILASGAGPQVIVSPGGLHGRHRQAARVAVAAASTSTAAPEATLGARPVGTPYAPPRSPVEKALAELWQQAIGMRQIGLDDDFRELGGSSIVAVRLVQRMSARFGVQVSLADVFEWRTLRMAAAAIEAAMEACGGVVHG
ncbi:SDR family NAD(P)-dependent oxidoreductase [Streptomyces luteogriseus]|uniref:SDR family NAD(P)-dependent oxidoreductase n=1 Tax=Streptomyces luteogriseus TaxID=68233 RepID=UPI00378CEA3C